MSYSLAEVKTAYDAWMVDALALNPQYAQFLAKINAVDPASPTATAQLEALRAERAVLKTAYDNLPSSLAALATLSNLGIFVNSADAIAIANATIDAVAAARPVTVTILNAALDKLQADITAAPKPADPIAGTLISSACVGVDKVGTYADGTGGTYTSIIEKNSVSCGYKPASETPPEAAVNNSTGTASTDNPATGARRFNPLGNFSSYTYQITLYMVSPDAYNNFTASGRKQINVPGAGAGTSTGAVVVAQSGGVNNAMNQRASGFELDYYIDDLKISQVINPKGTGTETIATTLSFVITEPYGFRFVTNLKKAMDKLKDTSTMKNYSKMQNASKQFFVLGIRFQGYDATGKIVTGADVFASDTVNPSAAGVFERFYDILITEMKFKIDGKATVYNIKAVSTPYQVGMGAKRGRLNNGARVVASEVWEAIGGDDSVVVNDGVTSLLDTINEAQQILATKNVKVESREGTPAIEIANVYKIRWLADSEELIGGASIISPADTDKSKLPMARTATSLASNEATSSTSSPDVDKRTLTFKNDTSIMQAISTIISQSSYLEDALITVAQSTELSNDNSDEEGALELGGPNKIRWYNLSTDIKVLGWDTKMNDFAYEITYVIQPYDTPAAISMYGNSPTEYYGPHKRYSYWYTGENSEILKYEQTLDNLYYNVVLGGTGTAQAAAADGTITVDLAQLPIVPNAQINGNKQGRKGEGMEAQNSYVANLNDPASFSNVKIQILGDPDFLMQTAPDPVGTPYDPYYGPDGKSVRPNANQIFIEIDFKEATDYNNNTGLLDINSSILFWKYPPTLAAKVHGVSYMVIKISSTFSKGAFIQDIEATINTFPNWKEPPAPAAAAAPAGLTTADYQASRDN